VGQANGRAAVGSRQILLAKEILMIISADLVTAFASVVTATAALIWALRRKR